VTAATFPALLIETGTEAEWLAARRNGITASEIAVVMGLSPYDSPFALYHRKRGDLPEIEDTDAMERGRVLEPYIADRFARLHPEFIVDGDGRALYAHPDRPWQMATPDRLLQESATCGIAEHDGVFEIENVAVLETKTDAGSDDAWGDDGTDQIPVHYRCQVLWQMDVLGVTAGYVACLAMRSWKLRVYELTMDDQAQADLRLMRIEALAFLDRLNGCGGPPDVDWRPQTAAALKHLHPSVEDRDAHIGRQLEISYRAALRRYREAGRRKDEMTNRLRQAMGTARRAVASHTRGADGGRVVIATRQVYEVAEHTRKASTVDKLVPAKPKKDTAP
jgi:putative phage-type endonuclease